MTAATAPATPTSVIADATLLDAALEAFARRGFDGASVRELARDLGVSHNFIPQRFGSKERLWYAAVEHGFRGVLGDLLEAGGDEADDLVRLQDTVVRFVEAMGTRPALLQIINQEAASPGPRLDHLFDTYIEPVRRFGEEVFAQLGGEERVRTTSVSLVYFMMTHGAAGPLAMPGLAERFGDRIDATDAEALHRYAVEAVDVLFHGLAAHP